MWTDPSVAPRVHVLDHQRPQGDHNLSGQPLRRRGVRTVASRHSRDVLKQLVLLQQLIPLTELRLELPQQRGTSASRPTGAYWFRSSRDRGPAG